MLSSSSEVVGESQPTWPSSSTAAAAILGSAVAGEIAEACADDRGQGAVILLLSADRAASEAMVHSGLAELVGRCWAQDPGARPSFRQVLCELRELRERLAAR